MVEEMEKENREKAAAVGCVHIWGSRLGTLNSDRKS